MRSRRKRVERRGGGGGYSITFVMTLIVASVMALGYLRLTGACESLGRQLGGMEARLRELDREYRHEESRWAAMRSPRNLEVALRRHGLTMTWPGESQLVRLDGSYPAPDVSYVMERGGGDGEVAWNE